MLPTLWLTVKAARYGFARSTFLLHTQCQQYITTLTRGRSRGDGITIQTDIIDDIDDPRNGLFLYTATRSALDRGNFAILRVSESH